MVEEQRRHSGLGNLAKFGAAGIGLAALSNRFRNRSRNPPSQPEVIGSRRHSGSYVSEEKYSQYGRDPGREGGWTDRLLKIGAVAGAVALARSFFNRRRNRDQDSDDGEYGPPLGGATNITGNSLERVEEGRPLPSNQHPLNQPLNHRRSTSSVSYDSYMSASGPDRHGHGVRDTVAGLGAAGLVGNIFKNWRQGREQKRVEAVRRKELENERIARANSNRYTGGGAGFPQRGGRRGSLTASHDYSSSSDNGPRYDHGAPPPLPAGAIPTGAAVGVAGATLADHDRNRARQQHNPGTDQPVMSGAIPGGPLTMPPVPQDPRGILHHDSSGSEAYLSAGGRNHRRHHNNRDAIAAGLAGGAAGLAAGEALSNRRDRRHSASGGEGSVASPATPVSVKVKMHSDGRHVTLRRLPEEEAAAEREARRRSKDRHGRNRRGGSVSSLGGADSSGERWRRTENLEQQQAEAMRRESEALAAARNQTLPVPLPPPPPIPGSSAGLPLVAGSVSSPGTYEGTEASADYANNRRRRRAERAQAKQAREARGGQRVEFT